MKIVLVYHSQLLLSNFSIIAFEPQLHHFEPKVKYYIFFRNPLFVLVVFWNGYFSNKKTVFIGDRVINIE